MFCALGSCRCLSTYIAVDAYCYEKISPSESGCFYDTQCSSVWPDAYCKNGMCLCPSEEMKAVKTRDGTMCVWSSAGEPACPLPSLPPPDSPAALVVLPATGAKTSVTIASCNPYSNQAPPTEEELVMNPHNFKCSPGDEAIPVDVSDIYDCIDNSVFWKAQGIESNAHPIGVCCMNRAFTCMQPRRGESDGLGAVPRWWFSAVTGSCQQFLFDPTSADVSPNNFETLDHCEAFCKDTCPRGNPSYAASKSHLGQTPQAGCTIAAPCPDPYQCTEVASQSLCCPSRKNICSDAGGRLKDPLRPYPYDPGMRFDQITGEKADYAFGLTTRYYYNPHDGQCHPFTYNGFLGNFNNFANQADCQLFCAKLQCPNGNPLTTGGGAPQRCQRDSDCPSTHTCSTEHAVCCPTPQTLCTEPLRVGDCKQSVRSFWYNAETRQCESFMYTGCQGNNNRFSSLNDCQSFCKNINAEPKCPQGRAYMDYSGRFFQCGDGPAGNACPANYECYFDGLVHGCCPSKAYTCSLQLNKGVACGSGSSYRYYYNNQMKECQSFLFLGCDGNSNNFPNAEKCQSYCEIAICPNGGSPLRTNSKVRSCTAAEPCPSGYECSTVEANGVTTRRCCPTKGSICAKPPHMGSMPKCSTGGGITRYYFNVALQSCSSYTSNGCDTSLNSFSTMAECDDFCLSAGCAAGDTVYKDPNSNKPFVCNTALQNNCPSNYQCTLNPLTSENNCCGSDGMGVCPEGEKAFIDARSSAARQCAMIADTKCPTGYLCRFSQQHNRYYCCGSISGSLCPSGRSLYRSPSTQSPIHCSISSHGHSCPNGFQCLSEVPGAFQGYCCSQHAVCPNGVPFHVDDKTQMPTSCTRDAFAFCPTGYTCQQQPETNNYYCCQGLEESGVQDGCPPNQFAYIVEGKAASCDPFNRENNICPRDYSCQWSSTNQKYQCCGTIPVRQKKPFHIDDGCSARQFALLDPRSQQPRLCTAGEANACPPGFFCQFSPKKNQFQCCGQSAGCPPRRAAFIAIDGNAQECLTGPDTCAEGYQCVSGSEGKNICCSEEGHETCSPGERWVDGKCVTAIRPGEPCTDSQQCVGGSSCIDASCTCPPEHDVLGHVCVPRECAGNEIRIDGQCQARADIGQQCKNSLQCTGNSKCLKERCDCAEDEEIANNKCVRRPSSRKSQEKVTSTTTTTEATTSEKEKPTTTEDKEEDGEKPVKPTKSKGLCPIKGQKAFYEKGTTRLRYCSPALADCPKGYNCQYSKLEMQNICCGGQTEQPSKHAVMCPVGMSPYLLNGKPKSCQTGTCPYGYQCKFSSAKHDYFCCSKNVKAKRTFMRRKHDGCERGRALLFPNTQEPVSCEPAKKGCPVGYACLPNISNQTYQCCSIAMSKDNEMMFEEVEIECPSYMTRVEREVNGVIKTFCEKPPAQ
ncbi:unnamed protein product, partial [Mesorhabditis spiculigera]